jgi:hypothetical protein
MAPEVAADVPDDLEQLRRRASWSSLRREQKQLHRGSGVGARRQAAAGVKGLAITDVSGLIRTFVNQ